jgi:hypothetical protein
MNKITLPGAFRPYVGKACKESDRSGRLVHRDPQVDGKTPVNHYPWTSDENRAAIKLIDTIYPYL